MRKVGIILNPKKEDAHALLPKIQTWLQKRDIQSLDSLNHPVEEMLSQVELIICLGGDGTILKVAGQMKEKTLPILGVNLGRLGFLTEVKQDEIFEELQEYFLGNSQIETRLMLSCAAESQPLRQKRRLVALNDFVISREGLSRMLHLEICVSGETITKFSGDGVILATPTGSTAYSLSAGGAVVHPKLEAMVITPICPHASALRSIVVSAEEKVEVRLAPPFNQKALLTADGQENVEIDNSFKVEITRSANALQLIKSSKRSYFGLLKENFKFPS